jgi:hypothetical protein
MNRRLSDLQLERYLAEALSADERAAIDRVLAESAPDAEAVRLLRAETAALFVTQPPAAFAEKVMPTKTSPWRAWFGALSAVAAAAALFVFFRGQEEDTRVKGGVGWHVTVSGKTGSRTLREGTLVTPGETLSFQVASDKPVFVAVVSHAPDGWWVYAPSEGNNALRVERGLTLVPEGAQLDETEGNETLFFVTGDEPFDPMQVRDALKNGFTPTGVKLEPMPIVKLRH